jgi:hypothetical protein
MTDRFAERWIEHVWDQEDITFYFEIGAERVVLRQVEIVTTTGRPQSAGALSEVTAALQTGGPEAVLAYEQRYGGLADQPLPEAAEPLVVPISEERFEEMWSHARQVLEALPPTD